ncbi:HNH endonuclease [Enterococcus sp. BWR-S5]|uniref:HNH endonuclease n=1 Tax=Enterococcus sp. BWR-S5 TaxID=2787714 RepID=UPI0019221437|nr:HNH endonuclease [Enterococcus sp. BWR-S5]MBL1227063.1 HNH endonuclease [Enterococcus sp. BWR-S5]
MSGIHMFVGSAQAQADSIKTMTEKEVQGYEAVLQSLNQFLSAEDLQTDAYNNGKAFFSGVLIPTVQAGILVSEAVGSAAQKFVTEYQAKVDPSDLKSEELEEKIQKLDTQIQHLEHLTTTMNKSDASESIKSTALLHQKMQMNCLTNAKKVLQETLDKLKLFHAESPAIFSEIAALEAAAKQGASQAKAGFNGQKFIMPTDLAWKSVVATKWKEYQDDKANNEFNKLKERIKKDGLPATKAEILADYHWSTIYNMYVHTKTGIPSPEVTTLYNKLIQAENRPQENQQLAFYNEMLRTGKHPITGKAITEAERLNAKAMVYALALQPFYYTALLGGAQPYIEKYIADLNKADDMLDVDGPGTYTGRYKKKFHSLDNIEMRKVEYTKRPRAEYNQLRSKFDNGIRKNFLKQLGENTEYLNSLGFDSEQIGMIQNGRPPKGWQVHHQLPLDDSGTNDFSNLLLIKTSPDHSVITTYQKNTTGHLLENQSMTLDWPFFNGQVYPTKNP